MMLTFVLPLTVNAASVSTYSTVLEDLSKDNSFDLNDYPHVSTDYSLDVVQIAESKNGELYVYVYQPSDSTRDYKAKYINMSVQNPTEKDTEYKLYSLTWLSSYGTLDKYVVNGFSVSDAADRYYNIATIYRPYDAEIDTVSEAVDNIQCKGYEVGQYWHAYYYNDELLYETKKVDIVEVSIKATGSVRYSEGFKLYVDACDSHYVAFSIDNFNVQKIYDADITYTIKNYSWVETYTPNNYSEECTSSTFVERDYLSSKEKASNDGDGWFGRTYTWNRIQDVSTFMSEAQNDANEEFTEAEKAALNNCQFVFRFLETDYTISPGTYSASGTYSTTENIGILRLHFLSDGKYYNLGVVSDLVGTDSDPDLDVSGSDDIQNFLEEMDVYLEDFLTLIMLVVLVILVLVIMIYLKPVGSMIIKGFREILSLIWSLITLPFHLIASLFSSK